MIMQSRPKDPFTKRPINAIRKHMEKVYPEEGCGVIVDKKFHPCENIAENPKVEFRIDPKVMAKFYIQGEVQAIVHSHVDCGRIPSVADQEGQISTDVIWGICSVNKGKSTDILWWGDQMPFNEYTKRAFIWGVWHCYALYRDWWLHEEGVKVPNFAVSEDFIRDGYSVFLDEHEKAGLKVVWSKDSGKPKMDLADLKRGDMLLANLRADFPNHCGVYTGNDIFLHHPEGGLSKGDLVLRYWKHITAVLRYEETT